MTTVSYTHLDVYKRQEYEEIEKKIAGLKAILGSEKKLMNVIKKELREVREAYADPRRTEIVDSFEEIVIEEEKPVADEAAVSYTHLDVYKRQVVLHAGGLRAVSVQRALPSGNV